MKLKTKFAILIFLIFHAFAINDCSAQIREVGRNNTYSTILEAIQNATIGATLIVPAGIYKEHNLTIKKPMCILGEPGATLDVAHLGYGFIVAANGVSIEGLTIKNTGQSYTQDFAAIYISKSRDFEVKNTILEQVTFGILIEKSHQGLIKNNIISGTHKEESAAGNGIHLWSSSQVIITQNEVFNLRDGIYFEFVTQSTVHQNNSHNNIRYGLHFMFSNNDSYTQNTFSENGAGVAVMFSKQIVIKYNTFSHNWGTASYGILLKEIYDAIISNNVFQENTIGINVEGSTRITYNNNQFVKNGWALKVRGACYDNVFTKNNFLHNSFDVSYNSNINNNSFNQNYWSSYTGYDLDKDGIGDVPFRPVKLFSYIVNETPETIVLLRSLFIDVIDFSEKVSPVFTPDNLMDKQPLTTPIDL